MTNYIYCCSLVLLLAFIREASSCCGQRWLQRFIMRLSAEKSDFWVFGRKYGTCDIPHKAQGKEVERKRKQKERQSQRIGWVLRNTVFWTWYGRGSLELTAAMIPAIPIQDLAHQHLPIEGGDSGGLYCSLKILGSWKVSSLHQSNNPSQTKSNPIRIINYQFKPTLNG